MYWDMAATTPVKPEVLIAMMPYFIDRWYNPSAIYEPAREIRRDIEQARSIVAESINAEPEEIFFTSGGSEANIWALNGFRKYIVSNLEHHSIESYMQLLSTCQVDRNSSVRVVSNDRLGRIVLINLIQLALTQENPDIVSIQMANNEIGTIQDIKGLAEIVHESGALFHTDAVQAFGKILIDVKDLGVDMMSVSGHKIGAPKGIGFLYISNKINKGISPLITGSQEFGLRGGTENVPYIIGLAKAVELIDLTEQKCFKELYDYAVESAKDFATPNGHPEKRLYNILSLTMKDQIDGRILIGLLHDQGHYVSAGSACNSHSNKPSSVLKAIGLSEDEATRTIRISFSEKTTKKDVDDLFTAIRQDLELVKMMGVMSSTLPETVSL